MNSIDKHSAWVILNELKGIDNDQYSQLNQAVRREIVKVVNFLNDSAATTYDGDNFAKALSKNTISSGDQSIADLLKTRLSIPLKKRSKCSEWIHSFFAAIGNLFGRIGRNALRHKISQALIPPSTGSSAFSIPELFSLIASHATVGEAVNLSQINKRSNLNGKQFFKNSFQKSGQMDDTSFTQHIKNIIKGAARLSLSRNVPLPMSSLKLKSLNMSDLLLLEKWKAASDTITVWNALAKSIGKPQCDLSQLHSVDSYIEYASGLADWMAAHKDQLSQLKELHLSHYKLTSLPSEICNLSQLQCLSLSYNKFTLLPSVIGNFSQLKELHLSHNKLTSLPSEMGKLTQLQHLYLSYNQLTSAPPEIGSLSQLQKFNLSHNQLSSLPSETGNLSKLQELSLRDNKLTSLPAEIGKLSLLQEFYLQGNKLTSLPPEIGNLSQLQALALPSKTSLLEKELKKLKLPNKIWVSWN